MKNIFAKIFGALIIISLFGCYNDQEKIIPVISISELQKNKLSLNDIAEEIKYIELDDSVLISKIINVNAFDSLFIIENRNEVLIYNNQGEFVNRIGNQGKGPDEYINVVDFPVDNESQNIYVVSSYNVYNYDYKGRFNYSFSLPENFLVTKAEFKNDELYFSSGFGSYEQSYDWMITDTLGEIKYKKENLNNEFISRLNFYKNQMFKIDNELFYWDELKDTIFQINDSGGTPAFLFADDKYRLKEEDVMSSLETFSNTSAWYLHTVLGNKRYLLLRFGDSRDKETIVTVLDRKTNKLHELNRTPILTKNISTDGKFVINGWDSGLAFLPRTKIKTKSGEWFVQWINAINLKAHVESSEFKNATPKYPEKKKQLEQLANSLDENDNPVLMLVKLKE